jgi:hypothetical protein
MYLNIITPSIRPNNLHAIAQSINIPRDSYRWIVVFDLDAVPDGMPDNAECYAVKDVSSNSGNAQRNYALSLVNSGHVYFNDDDTTMHPDLWGEVSGLSNDFISFMQQSKDGKQRLQGNYIQVGHIDSHNFIVHSDIIEDSRFILNLYEADGYFARECYNKASNPIYLEKVLSIYNSLCL